MKIEVKKITEKELEYIEDKTDEYDLSHIKYKLEGRVSLGAYDNGKLVGAIDGCMTTFKIFYVCTLYVEEEYRRKGIGTLLMNQMEMNAKKLGANLIRLDTFDFQGKDFYMALNYEKVGEYHSEEDNFSEYFFLKRI